MERVHWNDVAGSIREVVDEDLYALLDRVGRTDGGKGKPLYLAKYSYGELLVEDGILRLPGFEPSSLGSADEVPDDLHSPIPLSLLIERSLEIYDTDPLSGLRIPLRILRKGHFFGLFEVLDELTGTENPIGPTWHVHSGARSIYIHMLFGSNPVLKGVADRVGANVGEIGSFVYRSSRRGDHSGFARKVAGLPRSGWTAKVAFFPRSWVAGESSEVQALQKALYKRAWTQSSRLRKRPSDNAWISKNAEDLNEVYTGVDYQSLAPFMRHLIDVGRGEIPAFRPFIAEQDGAKDGPLPKLSEILSEVIEETTIPYHPVILCPTHLDPGQTGFISLRHPTYYGHGYTLKKSYSKTADNLCTAIDFIGSANRIPRISLEHFKFYQKKVYITRDERNDYKKENRPPTSPEAFGGNGSKEKMITSYRDLVNDPFLCQRGLPVKVTQGSFLSDSVRFTRM